MNPGRRALLTFALITACLAGIAVVTGDSVDSRILLAFPRTPALTDAAVSITALGSSILLILFTLIAASFLLLERQFRSAVVAAAAYTGAEILSQSIKHLVDRARPTVVPHLVQTTGASFPSGHAMLSAAVYLTFGALLARSAASPRLRSFFLAIGVLLTFMIGLSRLYLGVHWPTDVLAGWSFGALWAFFLLFAHERKII